jgi:hypothetical protein
MDEFEVEVAVDLGAEAADHDIDDIGLGVEAIVPDVFEDEGFGYGAAGVAHEVFEELELAGLEFDFFAGAVDGAVDEVEFEVGDLEGGGFCFAVGAADEGLDASEEFTKGERFDEVIITAGLESADAVIDGAFGAEEEDRGADVLGAELADEGDAVEFREHDIDDGGVVGGGGGEVEGVFAVGGMIDGEASLAQAIYDEGGDLRVIFHHEDTHDWG